MRVVNMIKGKVVWFRGDKYKLTGEIEECHGGIFCIAKAGKQSVLLTYDNVMRQLDLEGSNVL